MGNGHISEMLTQLQKSPWEPERRGKKRTHERGMEGNKEKARYQQLHYLINQSISLFLSVYVTDLNE